MLGKRQYLQQEREESKKGVGPQSAKVTPKEDSSVGKFTSSSRMPDSARNSIIKTSPFLKSPLLNQSSNLQNNQVLMNLKSVREKIIGSTVKVDDDLDLPQETRAPPQEKKVLPQNSGRATYSPKLPVNCQVHNLESAGEESYLRLSAMAEEIAELDETKILASLNQIGQQRTSIVLTPQKLLVKSGSSREIKSIDALVEFSAGAGWSSKSKAIQTSTKGNFLDQIKNPVGSQSARIMEIAPKSFKNLPKAHVDLTSKAAQPNRQILDLQSSQVSVMQNELESRPKTPTAKKSPSSDIRKSTRSSVLEPKDSKPQSKTKISVKTIETPKKKTNVPRGKSQVITNPLSSQVEPAPKLDGRRSRKDSRSASQVVVAKKAVPAKPEEEVQFKIWIPTSKIDERSTLFPSADDSLNGTYEESHWSQQAQFSKCADDIEDGLFRKLVTAFQRGVGVFKVTRDTIGAVHAATRVLGGLQRTQKLHQTGKSVKPRGPRKASTTSSHAGAPKTGFARRSRPFPSKADKTKDSKLVATAPDPDVLWKKATASRLLQQQKHVNTDSKFFERVFPSILAGLSPAKTIRLLTRIGFG